MIKKYKHIIWDWNGTLLDDTKLCINVLNQLLQRRNRSPITTETYRENFGFPVVNFYQYLGFDVASDSFNRVSHEFIENYEARWFQEAELHAETSVILDRLSALGLTHSVLSAAKQEALEIGIEYFGIRTHFSGLMGTDNIKAAGKIDQGHRWVKQLEWDIDQIVLVGDTLHDYEVAQAIGTDCILMAHGHHTAERLEATGVPLMRSLAELVVFLQDQ